jgi:hypothetical protein
MTSEKETHLENGISPKDFRMVLIAGIVVLQFDWN